MGLERVELAGGLESHFRIRLPVAALASARTVGDLAAAVLCELPRCAHACPTASRFYTVRRALMTHADVVRAAIAPGAALTELLPRSTRRRDWRALRAHDPALPALDVSWRIDAAFCVVTALGVFGWLFLVAASFASMGATTSMILALTTLVGGAAGLLLAYRRAAVCFPAGVSTVGDLVRATVTPMRPSDPAQRRATAEKVLEDVRRAVAELIDADPDEITASVRLDEDLGLD